MPGHNHGCGLGQGQGSENGQGIRAGGQENEQG